MGTISDKLTYLATTKSKIKTMLQYANSNVTDLTTFRAYFNELFQAYLNIMLNPDNLFNILPKITTTPATSFNVNNTVESPVKINLYGNTEQNGTPTSDNPVNVETVTGRQEIDIVGKNLFRLEEGTLNGITVTKDSDGGYLLNGTSTDWTEFRTNIPLVNELHTMSCKSNSTSSNVRMFLRTSGGTLIEQFALDETSKELTSSSGNIEMTGISIAQGTALTNFKFYPMLKYGNEATTYEPYQGQSYEINLGNIELCKIGNYKDRIFKNESNSNLEIGSWYIEKKIGKVVLNGSENWGNSPLSLPELVDVSGFTLNNSSMFGTNNLGGYCDKLRYDYAYRGNYEHFYIYNNYLYFYINKTIATTKAQLVSWLGTNNTPVYCVLATPTYTKITESVLIEQLNDLEKANSYNNQTNINQGGSLPFILDIELLQDIRD